jgi:AcrR family transcriptional regulator
MPRKADTQLEDRILNTAYSLWANGGEHAVTMRAVAKAARTTTPTLYERFKDKNDLLSFLRHRAQQKLLSAIEPARTIGEACRLALEFTLAHGHEYELVASDWAARLARKEPTPAFDLISSRLAQQLGGTAEGHRVLALAVTALYHGAAMLLLTEGIDETLASNLMEACVAAADALVKSASNGSSAFRSGKDSRD